jgi:hypothetical protein
VFAPFAFFDGVAMQASKTRKNLTSHPSRYISWIQRGEETLNHDSWIRNHDPLMSLQEQRFVSLPISALVFGLPESCSLFYRAPYQKYRTYPKPRHENHDTVQRAGLHGWEEVLNTLSAHRFLPLHSRHKSGNRSDQYSFTGAPRGAVIFFDLSQSIDWTSSREKE